MSLFTLRGHHILNYLHPWFAFFAFSLFIGSALFNVYLESSSLDIKFSLVFHYSTSKPEASSVGSSLVFDYYKSKQVTQTQCSCSVQTYGFESVVWLWI